MSPALPSPAWVPSPERALSALLWLELALLFVLIPLRELQLVHAAVIVLAAGLAVLSALLVARHSRRATLVILASGLAGAAGAWFDARLTRQFGTAIEASAVIAYGIMMLAVIGRIVFGPGRVTAHRVRGAVLFYIKIAVVFAGADWLLADLVPGAFAGGAAHGIAGEADAVYYSFVTMTTLGYGDIVPLHPVARSLANLEGLIGQLFPATLLARLVTLEIASRAG